MDILWLQGLFLNSNLNDIFPFSSACGLNISCEKAPAVPGGGSLLLLPS